MEQKAVKGAHVIGDATLSAPAMPKSASMANNHGKIAAAAIIELLNGRTPEPLKIINTCYSFVAENEAIRVSSVHEWEPGQATLVAVKGSGGVSPARSGAEATYAWNWARTIWADSLAELRPVEPKPPAPRALAANSSTPSSSTCITGTTMSWATRSRGWTLKGARPRFHSD